MMLGAHDRTGGSNDRWVFDRYRNLVEFIERQGWTIVEYSRDDLASGCGPLNARNPSWRRYQGSSDMFTPASSATGAAASAPPRGDEWNLVIAIDRPDPSDPSKRLPLRTLRLALDLEPPIES